MLPKALQTVEKTVTVQWNYFEGTIGKIDIKLHISCVINQFWN
jgi:hypothetical protein